MKKSLMILASLMALTGSARAADTVTAAMLQKDYIGCMAGETAQQNPEKNQYCLCVRDSMKGWSMEQYGELAEAESKAKTAADMPQSLKDIAQACMAKIAH